MRKISSMLLSELKKLHYRKHVDRLFQDAKMVAEKFTLLKGKGGGGNFPSTLNPLKPELNPICYLLALLRAHHFLHVSRIRVKLLTFRRLMSYIYIEHPFLKFLDHTQRRSTVGRTPLDE